jgi:hypothetical protein
MEVSGQEDSNSVTLGNLIQAIGSQRRDGAQPATAKACFCLSFAIADMLMVLLNSSPVANATGPWFEQRGVTWGAPALSLLLQCSLLFIGLRALSNSTLKAIIDPSLAALVSFGASFRAKRTALIARGATFIACAAILGIAAASIPSMDPSAPRAGALLSGILVFGFPLTAAWLLVVLIFRIRIDRFVAIGLALGGVAMMLALVAFAPSPNESANVLAPSAPMPPWLHLLELALVWVALLGMVGTIVSNPLHTQVFKIVDTDIEAADLCVDYSPFDTIDRSPRSVMFQLGRGRIMALTRRYRADYFDVIDTADDHLIVPIHDRSLKIWNITRLLASIPPRIDALDSLGYFRLQVSLGTLSNFAKAGRRINRTSVDRTNEIIFKNSDLNGLLVRAAREAFEEHVKSARAGIDKVFLELANPPSAITATLTQAQATTNDELVAWISQLQSFQEQAQAYVGRLVQLQTEFDAIHHGVADWRSSGKERSSSVRAALEDQWYDKIISDISGDSIDPELDHEEAHYVLRAAGLRFNEVTISLEGRAQDCLMRLASVRKDLEERLEAIEALYASALQRRTEFGHDLVKAIVDKPGMVTPKTAPLIIDGLLGNRPPPHSLPPAQSMQPLSTASDPASLPNGNADLNDPASKPMPPLPEAGADSDAAPV